MLKTPYRSEKRSKFAITCSGIHAHSNSLILLLGTGYVNTASIRKGNLSSCSLSLQAPPELRAVANFLRGKNGPKVRRGVLNGSRSDYFKGMSSSPYLLSFG